MRARTKHKLGEERMLKADANMKKISYPVAPGLALPPKSRLFVDLINQNKSPASKSPSKLPASPGIKKRPLTAKTSVLSPTAPIQAYKKP